METKDWIGLVGLVVTFAMSLVALVLALRHNSAIREHNTVIRQYASAAPDIALLGQINQARLTMANIAFKMAEVRKGKTPDRLTANEDRQILEMRSAYSQAVVTLLMSYDLACRLYRDGAVDRDRFRRQHEYETRKLFEEGTDEDRALLQSVATPYQALRAVYVDWFVKEKQ